MKTKRLAGSLLPVALLLACAAPKTAPPPAGGDVSGAWLLEASSDCLRFATADGDTLCITVGPQPVRLAQGEAVSDTTISLQVSGLSVSGILGVWKNVHPGTTTGTLATAGGSADSVWFREALLQFRGLRVGDGRIAGEYAIDANQLPKNAVVLDGPMEWSLRRLE